MTAVNAHQLVVMQRTHWSNGVVRNSRFTAKAELAQALPDSTECTEVDELLSKMLQLEPQDRPTALQLLADPWLSRNHV